MTLLQQLATALNYAILEIKEHGEDPRLEHWQSLVKKVQDLDSALFLPAKCKAAGCIPSVAGGPSHPDAPAVHVCGQDHLYTVLAKETTFSLATIDESLGESATQELAESIIREAIAQAMNQAQLSEDRKKIEERLKTLGAAFAHQAALSLAVPRYTLEDLLWLHSLAVKVMALYAVELRRGWCLTHKRQTQFCPECVEAYRSATLKALASAVKKVCAPEVVEALVAAAHPEEDFIKFLQESPKDNVDKTEGVGF